MGCTHGSQRNLGQGKKSSLVMALYCPNHSVQLTLHSPMITFYTQIIYLQSFCKRGRIQMQSSDSKNLPANTGGGSTHTVKVGELRSAQGKIRHDAMG